MRVFVVCLCVHCIQCTLTHPRIYICVCVQESLSFWLTFYRLLARWHATKVYDWRWKIRQINPRGELDWLLNRINLKVLVITFLESPLILQTSILRAIELSMFLTKLIYVLICFNCWLITLHWKNYMELFASDLHINQILVDNSVGAMDWGVGLGWGEVWGIENVLIWARLCGFYWKLGSFFLPPHQISPLLPPPFLGPSLVSCQFSALKPKMQNALAWLFGENRNCLSGFYDVLSLSRLHFNASCQHVWDLKGKRHNLALSN